MGNPASKSSFKNNLSNQINFVNSSIEEEFSIKKDNDQEQNVLTKFTWHYGGNNVILKGTFTNWKRGYTMEREGEEFFITLELPRAIHQYKFLVDGNWRFSPQHPTMPDENGHTNNFIDTRHYQPLMEESKVKKQIEYSGPIYQNNENDRSPPESAIKDIVPPKLSQHYEMCFYLSQKSQTLPTESVIKGGSEMNQENEKLSFEASLTEQQIRELFTTAHCLQMPTHITLDHLMTCETEEYLAMSITQRCKEKYATYTLFNINPPV